MFYVGRVLLKVLRSGPEVLTHANARTSPSQGRGDHHALPPSGGMCGLPVSRCGTRKPRERGMEHLAAYDVL